ncbi:hypothetical protein [Actinomadura decatromicini]|uniref:hypothetical protein n=1 Tax=Actinomadura decatromicini TaxID=2604572 RepID=UPI0016530232|nr:hypothetical protein [Actinomadura decatromicini]
MARRPGTRTPAWRRPLVAGAASSVLLLAGAGLGAAGALQASEGGYFSTSPHRFATPAAALKSDEIDVGTDSAHAADPNPDIGEAARVRIVVRASDPSVPVFVGIGPKARVEAYLRGTAYDDFRSADLKPFRATFARVPGAARAPAPAGRPLWVATAQGTGTRTLTWDKTGGAWSVVVMRLDGRPGVDVTASIGLRFGFLVPAAAGALLTGTLLLGYVAWARRRPGDSGSDSGSGSGDVRGRTVSAGSAAPIRSTALKASPRA